MNGFCGFDQYQGHRSITSNTLNLLCNTTKVMNMDLCEVHLFLEATQSPLSNFTASFLNGKSLKLED